MNRTRTSKNAKRLLVWLLLLTMVFGLLPMAAFADETVVEPVVSEEPVQEPTEPSSEPTEPSSEPSAEPSQEPEPEQPGNAEVTIEGDEEQPEDELLAEEISFNYAEKTQSVRLSNGEFQRIFLLDCGRKYFTTTEVKAIIDELQKNHYTHIELRFLYNGIIIKHQKTEPTYTKTSLFLCEKRRFFMARREKGVVPIIYFEKERGKSF